MRGLATFLFVFAAGLGATLALPGSVQAAEQGISSIIEQDLDRALDRIQQENELQELKLLEAPGGMRSVFEVDPTVVRHAPRWPIQFGVEANLEPPDSNNWSELAAYEEIRFERHRRQGTAGDRNFAALESLPLSGARVAIANQGHAGASLSRNGPFACVEYFASDRAPRRMTHATPLMLAALDRTLRVRNYYAIRNGYYGDPGEVDRIARPAPELVSPAAFAPVSFRTAVRLSLSFSISSSSLSPACESASAASAFFVSIFQARPAPHLAAGHRFNLFGDRT